MLYAIMKIIALNHLLSSRCSAANLYIHYKVAGWQNIKRIYNYDFHGSSAKICPKPLMVLEKINPKRPIPCRRPFILLIQQSLGALIGWGHSGTTPIRDSRPPCIFQFMQNQNEEKMMKITIQNRGFLWMALLFAITIASQAEATEYYVDQGNPSANDSNSGSAALPWKTITKANQTLNAGDSVYIKSGVYSSYIAPSRSGTSTSPITYKNFGTDTVTISNTTNGILLNGKSYIVVQGLNFSNLDTFLYLQNGANHNIIAYSNFDQGRSMAWAGSVIQGNSSYNWIHHSKFSNYGTCQASYGSGSGQGSVLDIGNEDSGTDASSYNVIEESTISHGGHHLMGVFSKYNTIRNNYFHNEAWSNGRGERDLYLQGYATNSGYVLFEGNRIGYASRPCNNAIPTTSSVKICTNYNIFRYNRIYSSVAAGIETYSYGSPYNAGSNNKIYNNTIFNSGYNIDPSYKGYVEDTAIWFSNAASTGNQVLNNLYSANYQVHSGNATINQTFANNWNGDKQGNPLFVSASSNPPANYENATSPNLDLQSGSPAIDKGGVLTTVTSATGSGTSIAVTNAGYFQDGSWGPAGVVQADWIAIGTPTNAVQITSITGNTIKLANTINWNTGDSVWLYKKSDGVRVLYGTKPDAGAYEFGLGNELSAPTNLRISP